MAKPPYKVGYGRPPAEHRFRPGQSGNPAGRKKGSKNLSTLVNEALNQTVVINANGKRESVSKLSAALIQQANKAASGELKSTKLMVDLLAAAEVMAAAASPRDTITPEMRRDVYAKVIEAVRNKMGGGDGE